MASVERNIKVNVPVEKFFAVITDYESYPEFLPEVEEVKILDKKGNRKTVYFKVKYLKTVEYTLDMVEEKNKEVRWKLKEGDFKKNEGMWKLKKEGSGTDATYSVDIEFSFPVPGFILKKLISVSLPQMLNRFKERAESLYG